MKWMTAVMSMSLFFLCTSLTHAFDNSNFKGNYAFKLVGPSSIVLANEPLTVATGIMLADGKGKVIGKGSFRSAGATCQGEIEGQYTIHTDGTGLLTSIIHTTTPGCFTIVLDLAMVLHNRGVYFDVSNTENDYMEGILSRQNKAVFSNADFRGSYALRFSGPSSVVRATQPLTVGTGVLKANGTGTISGHGVLRSAGATCHGIFTGNYGLKPDGRGLITTNFVTADPGCFTSVMNWNVAFFRKGNSAYLANSDNDYLAGALHRQILQ